MIAIILNIFSLMLFGFIRLFRFCLKSAHKITQKHRLSLTFLIIWIIIGLICVIQKFIFVVMWNHNIIYFLWNIKLLGNQIFVWIFSTWLILILWIEIKPLFQKSGDKKVKNCKSNLVKQSTNNNNKA